MTARVVAALWLLAAVAIWNGIFDLYVSRGARHYLQLQAEFELGREPQPSMTVVMDRAKHDGAIAASLWACAIAAGGWATLAVRLRRTG